MRRKPAVIITVGTEASRLISEQTSEIPIIFSMVIRADVLMADVRAELLPLIGEALRHVENKANARRALHVAPVRA